MANFKNIKLICLDVDGTLTNGQIYISNDGVESKSFNVKDGMAIAQAIKVGYIVVIITGRNSKTVEIRAKELGITEIHQGIHTKFEKLEEILTKYKLTFDNVLYMGDDINDLSLASKVKLFACPKDSSVDILKNSHIVSSKNGGEGAVRDILEKMLRENVQWNTIINNYKGGGQ